MPGNAGGPRASAAAGVSRLQVLPRAVRRRRVSGNRAGRARRRDGAARRARCSAPRARGSSPDCSVRPAGPPTRALSRPGSTRGRRTRRTRRSRRSRRSAASTGARVHVAPPLQRRRRSPRSRRAQDRGAAVTAETCPHYLTFAAEEIPDGATQFKCAPPIREPREPRARSGTALADGRHRPGRRPTTRRARRR